MHVEGDTFGLNAEIAAHAEVTATGRVPPGPEHGYSAPRGPGWPVMGIAPSGQLEGDYTETESRVLAAETEAHESRERILAKFASDANVSVADLTAAVDGADAAQKGRMLMASLDPLLRTLPFEARTAVLLNLIVTYVAEEPGVINFRGKAIKALTADFQMRLQRYLPIITP